MNLHQQLLELRRRERQITSEILEKLQIAEDYRSYLKMGYSSLFDYLVRGLGYSESLAYQRQSCVRLCRELPEIKSKIEKGKLTYSTVSMAYTATKGKKSAEKRQLINEIENKSAREVKEMLRPEAPQVKVKKSHYSDKTIIRIELTNEQYGKLNRLKALKSHKHSFDSLFVSLIEKELKLYDLKTLKRKGENKIQSKDPHYIPRRLRNDVLKRGKHKCQYPGCEQTHFLQIDHIKPVRKGGKSTEENLQVLCQAHNKLKG